MPKKEFEVDESPDALRRFRGRVSPNDQLVLDPAGTGHDGLDCLGMTFDEKSDGAEEFEDDGVERGRVHVQSVEQTQAGSQDSYRTVSYEL